MNENRKKRKPTSRKGQSKYKYDWARLKIEFFKGPWQSVKEYKKAKGFPDDYGYVGQRMAGWKKEKDELLATALQHSTEKMVQKDMDDVKSVQIRQANLAKFLQLKGAKGLRDLHLEDVEDARKMLISGMKEEREIYGMGKRGKQSLTQINVNLPTTKLDKAVEGMSYEELLEFVAELKRERAGRSLPSPVAESPTEIKQN